MNKEFGDWRDENSGVVHHRLDGFVEELGDDLSNVMLKKEKQLTKTHVNSFCIFEVSFNNFF